MTMEMLADFERVVFKYNLTATFVGKKKKIRVKLHEPMVGLHWFCEME